MKPRVCGIVCLFIAINLMIFGCRDDESKNEQPPESIMPVVPAPKDPSALNEEPANVLEQKTWVLESYGESGNLKAVVVAERFEITAIFNLANASITGFGGCNRYQARFDIVDDKLSIDAVWHTKRGCADFTAQEDEYFMALEATERYQVKGNRLRIFYANTRILNYNARKEADK